MHMNQNQEQINNNRHQRRKTAQSTRFNTLGYEQSNEIPQKSKDFNKMS